MPRPKLFVISCAALFFLGFRSAINPIYITGHLKNSIKNDILNLIGLTVFVKGDGRILATSSCDEKGKFVMTAVKENGKTVARKKVVVIGQFYGDKMEIKSGLQAGDVVVTDGYQSLYEGQLITTDTK